MARVVFLDATGALATTFGGAQIGDSVLELKSASFGSAIAFNPTSPVNINNNSGYQEFEITYNPAAITEPGDDVITATLKKGTTSISVTLAIKVLAPVANTYVTRTGLASALIPEVLEAIPGRTNNAGAIITAGSALNVTGHGSLWPVTPIFLMVCMIRWYFTDNVPAGAETVNISGSATHPIIAPGAVTIAQTSATLENGIATVSATAQDLKINDILEKAPNVGAQAALMDDLLNPNYVIGSTFGVQPTWSASGSLDQGSGYLQQRRYR